MIKYLIISTLKGMIEDEFYSDEDSSSSLSDNDSNPTKTFGNLYQRKQVETLKFLRNVLKENKILKRRLNLMENELERYQEFKGFYPAVEDRASSIISNRSNEDYCVTTDDKECQTDILVSITENHLSRTPIESPNLAVAESLVQEDFQKSTESLAECNEKPLFVNTITELKEEPVQEKLVHKVDKASQCDKKQPVNVNADLIDEFDCYKLEKEEEINALNQNILQLKVNNKQLMEKYNSVMKSHEMTNMLLNEFKLEVETLKDQLKEINNLKIKIGLLSAENEQLGQNKAELELLMDKKKVEIENLNETLMVLNGNFIIMDRQREKIEFLESENEKWLNEKHVECEKRIDDLTNECQSHVDFIEVQKNELRQLHVILGDLSEELDKTKKEMKSFNFKEFILLRRELAQLKQEKEKLFANEMKNQAATAVPSSQQALLPPIKENKQMFKFFH